MKIINFMGLRKVAAAFSIALILGSIGSLVLLLNVSSFLQIKRIWLNYTPYP